jgi:hypothetical protein
MGTPALWTPRVCTPVSNIKDIDCNMSSNLCIGRYYHEAWEFELLVVRTSGEGNISGTVEIKRGGSTRSLLTSSGVFKTKQQLATHLKSRALDWVSRPCNTGNDERASPAAPEPALR